MAQEKFMAHLRAQDQPHGNRSKAAPKRDARGRFQRKTGTVDMSAFRTAELLTLSPGELAHRRISLPREDVKRPKTLPMYPAYPAARSWALWEGKRTGSKCAPHPMRGFRSPKAAHRNAA